MNSTVDPIEQSRIRSGRPASRAEILDRHMREHRVNAALVTSGPESPATITRDGRPVGHGAPMIAFEGIRRSISRFLMSAAQRIEPEAA